MYNSLHTFMSSPQILENSFRGLLVVQCIYIKQACVYNTQCFFIVIALQLAANSRI